MFNTVQDFTTAWANEAQATQRTFDLLTDLSLSGRIGPEFRSLGQLAWHLVTTIHEMMSRPGLIFASPGDDEHVPDSAKEIAEAYRHTSDAMLHAVRTQWTDADLRKSVNMYGEEWPNALTMLILIQHQIHHRGQMTVLMRQAGLPVPDIYGPTREDWLQRGMQPLR